MLLIVTNREDLTADWLILELQRRKAPFIRFNAEDYPERWKISLDPGGIATLTNGETVRLDDVRCIWFRRPPAPRPRSGLAPEEAAWAARESAEGLMGMWATYGGRWVSHPDAIRAAERKARQVRDARELGFDVPDTVITNEPDSLKALFHRSAHGVVCKALTHGRVRGGDGGGLLFTTRLDPSYAGSVGPEPHIFQAFIPKMYDVRVTVIGDEPFATRIESQDADDSRVDWRRASRGLRHAPERLPDELAALCVRLVAAYGLAFGAIDLARREDGGYTFFELNPNGQWAWIEQRTGVPLRARLADVLLGNDQAA